ncbi:MFS transporter [Chelatococcus reniformis]|uniref:MFS transporter n=1 Tax=Chelatococcus reniformis TaxID=1494448 RepID=A0A916U808_9HYPH|nr:MFS transporter [Chelatococcus reniformis]GGC63145.1 MFS transporter [Chelatococcus reniformis]
MRFVVVAALSCQQYLAIALIYAAVPVIMRQGGAPLELIGLFGTVFFAFSVNFLWAPLVDRYSLGPLGLRRSWIFAMQLGSAALVALMASRDPDHDYLAILALSLGLATLAATQRIATLGYLAEALDATERPLGTALFGWGGALGNVIGGALCLHLITIVGWQPALLGFAGLLAVFAAAIPLVPEPMGHAGRTAPPTPLLGIIASARLWRAVAVVSPAVFGIAVAFAMAQPRLVDLQFGAIDIGYIGGTANIATFTIVGPLTAYAVAKVAPGRAVFGACGLLAVGFALLVLTEQGPTASLHAVLSIAAIFSALAIQHVAFTSWFLSLAKPGEAATDVTFLTSMMSAVALLGFAASGVVAQRLGYGSTLLVAALGYFLSGLLALAFALHRQLGADQPAAGTP